MADYGVPQSRRRLVLFAGRGFTIPFPEVTHAKNPQPKSKLKKWLTLRDVVAKQPKPIGMSKARKSGGPRKYKWHVARDPQKIFLEFHRAEVFLQSDASVRRKRE